MGHVLLRNVLPAAKRHTDAAGRCPSDALVTLNGETRKAMADQITTVSILRVGTLLGVLSPTDMAAVEQAVRVQLGL